MSRWGVASLASAPKIARSGVRITYPALGRVAEGFRVIQPGLDVPMSAPRKGVSLKSGRSAADSAAIRTLLWDYYEDRISRAELDDGIDAVKRFGAFQPDLW